ncbi:hypothetical protein PHISP_07935 [Aspergillus sp. HF37]|nr:hypothetical protein PHISP_07935 [Aspergillus sp. HF37]
MITRITARPLLHTSRIATPTLPPRISRFSTSGTLRDGTNASLPAKKPVGAFRGGVFGFLSGALAAGGAVYYYILAEYRVSNEMLTEDIYALQSATQTLQSYIVELEKKVDQVQARK